MKQAVEERPIVRACEHCLDLTRQADCLINGPLREEPRVNHEKRCFAMMEGLATKPGDQLIAVARVQDVVNRILVSYRSNVFRYCEQEEIMIAEHQTDGIAETSYESEEGEGVRASIDEVAGQPQSIRLWIERNSIEEPCEWIEAALDVADCVYGHECMVPWTGEPILRKTRKQDED